MAPINGRTVMAPAAAATMALLLLAYTRSSISAARTNARKPGGPADSLKARPPALEEEATLRK
jgi:hypothetical protein